MKKTPLRRYTPLKSYKGLNPVSDRQKLINALWREITDQKAKDLNNICQWCHLPGRRDAPFNKLIGHHIIKRRYQLNTYENCFVCHRLCHNFIEINNIDVAKHPLNNPRNRKDTIRYDRIGRMVTKYYLKLFEKVTKGYYN